VSATAEKYREVSFICIFPRSLMAHTVGCLYSCELLNSLGESPVGDSLPLDTIYKGLIYKVRSESHPVNAQSEARMARDVLTTITDSRRV